MEIRLLSLLEGAQQAEGTTIIIDVYRAYTTAAVAFERGVEKIILVAEVEEALDLRAKGLGDLCVGEVEGTRPAGFDFGNSPYEIARADLRGKTLIQSTRAGPPASTLVRCSSPEPRRGPCCGNDPSWSASWPWAARA